MSEPDIVAAPGPTVYEVPDQHRDPIEVLAEVRAAMEPITPSSTVAETRAALIEVKGVLDEVSA